MISIYGLIPDCCKNCRRFDYDWDEYHGKTWYYCNIHIKLPTKKKTCKKF